LKIEREVKKRKVYILKYLKSSIKRKFEKYLQAKNNMIHYKLIQVYVQKVK